MTARSPSKKSPGTGTGPVPISRAVRRSALIELLLGALVIIASLAITAAKLDPASTPIAFAYVPVMIGLVAMAHGLARMAPSPRGAAAVPRPDSRRWIYAALALVLALVQVLCLLFVIPNRLPSAAVHLWSFPVFTAAMGAGALLGRRAGWWVGVLAGSAVFASVILVIVRILISAAFLAGVYGAFGKAAATFSFVAIALIVEAVLLLPILHVKFLMSRAGRRAYGVGA